MVTVPNCDICFKKKKFNPKSYKKCCRKVCLAGLV